MSAPAPALRCPMCRQSVPPEAQKRVCTECARQIARHDKWHFFKGRIRHRHCENPEDYFSKAVRKRYFKLKVAGKEHEAWMVLKTARMKR